MTTSESKEAIALSTPNPRQGIPLRFIGIVWLIHRLCLTAIGVFGAMAFPVPMAQPDARFAVNFNASSDPLYLLLDPWWRWDAHWYVGIAQQGYLSVPGSTNFPPLYPALIAVLSPLCLGNALLAALLISNIAYFGTLVFLYGLTVQMFTPRIARRTVTCLALLPSAFFMLGAYTESLFLCLTLAAFYYCQREKWVLTIVMAVLAALTRTQGALIVLPLLYLMAFPDKTRFDLRLGVRRLWQQRLRMVLLVGTVGGSYALFLAYTTFVVKAPSPTQVLRDQWGIKIGFPWESLIYGLSHIYTPETRFYLFSNILDLCSILIAGGLIILWFRKGYSVAYGLYAILTLLVILTRSGQEGLPWLSAGRYTLALFPCVMLLGHWRPRRPVRFLLVVALCILQVVLATFFVLGAWVE